ncbi:MAG: HlyD family efflux transporter periplasmic adaptor subunit [Planctomycetota bacterium]
MITPTQTAPSQTTRTAGHALGDAAYHESDFPALRLARSARFIRGVGRVLLTFLLVMVAAMIFAPWQQSIRGEGAVTALDPYERITSIQAPIKGRIAERGEGIRENAFVEKGQLLFKIEDQDPLYLSRLEQQVANAEAALNLAQARLENANQALTFSQQSVERIEAQIEDETLALAQLMDAADSLVLQAVNKLAAEQSKLLGADADLFQAKEDYNRKKGLFEKGIESEINFQIAEQKFEAAKAKRDVVEQDINNATNGVAAKESERESKRAEWSGKINKVRSELQKANGAVAKAEIDIRKNSEEIAAKNDKLLDAQRKLAVQQTQEVRAPRAGHIMDLTVFDEASIVKPGQQLCRLVPRTENPAVQVWVSGNDAPLIAPGRHVRLQFEGWPAVQFSGWPSVAVGTFGGTVALVDATDDGMGKFRVVITPDPEDQPWPEYPYLRQGVRSNGWVLLDQVPLGYEVWRRMNGFPPALQSKDAQKEPKPPKIKI